MKILPSALLWLVLPFTAITQDTSHVILSDNITRTWISPEIWANPLQDWQLSQGRIECISGGGGRNIFLLTRELADNGKGFSMSVSLGRLTGETGSLDPGWAGFIIGVRGDFQDYRDDAVRGEGYPLGITTGGKLFIGNHQEEKSVINPENESFELRVVATPAGADYTLILTVLGKQGRELGRSTANVDSGWMTGGVALSCSYGPAKETPPTRGPVSYGNWGFKPKTERKGNVRFWFSDWQLAGERFVAHPERVFGPILFCQYSLSANTLKLTAQLVPAGKTDDHAASLELFRNGTWTVATEAPVDPLARTATFRITGWNGKTDINYRVTYNCRGTGNNETVNHYTGTIRHEPWEKEEITVAGFTGNNDLGFPNNDIVRGVTWHNPDILFFSGDQIYEGVGGFGVQTEPLDRAVLDYLRKWYLYGWAYGELLRDRPSLALPDDHDVYHGNVWGAGGIATPKGLTGAEAQDKGGYKMPPEWVNMVQRTQTSHMPDPVDPAPVAQGIGVYFTEMNYAGVSFAVIEDRKFKSAPAPLLPEAKIYNGFAGNPDFDLAKKGDVPGAVLLGERQEKFLDRWTSDWSNGTWMKVVLSQTIFANVATLPVGESNSDASVPKLRVMKAGEYPENDTVVQDMDSDGWPQTPRTRALRLMRKGFALHIAGDQHLGSVIRYGTDNWRDAGYAFCVPAISNVWPRRWCPAEEGTGRLESEPRYTGDYLDGFGNKITVFAVSNPIFTGLEPAILYDRATGYGIVRMNRKTRDITMECWPRISNPADPQSPQFPGWPIKINQLDNRTRVSKWELPLIQVPDLVNPVVQVVSESTGEILFTLRINGNSYRPVVDQPGKYTVRAGEPGSGKWKELKGLKASPAGTGKELTVRVT